MIRLQAIFTLLFLIINIKNPLVEKHTGMVGRATMPVAAIYTWQLVRWSDGLPLCLIEVTHDGLPTGAEIYTQCGAERYQSWLNTPPCDAASSGGIQNLVSGSISVWSQ